jgi:hypothetical protein
MIKASIHLENIDTQLENLSKPALLSLLGLIENLKEQGYSINAVADLLSSFAELPKPMQSAVIDSTMARIKS